MEVFIDLEVFVNDTPVLFKYADDSTIVGPVWKDSDTSADLVRESSFNMTKGGMKILRGGSGNF